MKKSLSKQKKIWSTRNADVKMSQEVIIRAGRKCCLCNRSEPEIKCTNSHFWGRYVSITRYDFENCDCVCFGCHFKIENAKQGTYRDYKIKQLGKEKYDALEKRYYQTRMSRREAIKKFMTELEIYKNLAK